MLYKLAIGSISTLTMLGVSTARAQYDWSTAFADAQCNGPQVEISVTLDVFGEVPAGLVGWVVDREVLGACVPPVQVGDVRPFPVGQQQYFVVDEPTIADRMTLYYVYAVDGAGQRTDIPWQQRTMFAQADCLGGPAARGTVVELYPGYYYLDVCDGQCWWTLSTFDGQYPPEMPGLVGEVINLYGEIDSGLEGPFVVTDSWNYAADGCSQVIPTHGQSWSALKGSFR